jgi:hypothetical protein
MDGGRSGAVETYHLTKSQSEMKKLIARTRFMKAINCVVFVNDVAAVSCQNAIFVGRNKRKRTKAIEDGLAHRPVMDQF